MPKRRLYSKDLRKVLTNTTVEYVEGDVVKPGEILYITHAALEDQNNAPTTISFGKYVGERFEGLEEEPSPIAGIRFHTEKTHHFITGERPVWRVEGGTSSDVLKGYMEGYYEPSNE